MADGRGRSRRSGCGASACSWALLRTTWKDEPGIAAFVQALQQLGWTDGRNVRIDYRWGDGNADNIRKFATELVALAPDVILASSSAAMPPLLQATRTIPIVFANVADPVGAGYVESLARPGGNVTGFTTFEYSHEREMAGAAQGNRPQLTRAAVLRDTAVRVRARPVCRNPGGRAVAWRGVAPVDVRDAGEIERAIAAFAQRQMAA